MALSDDIGLVWFRRDLRVQDNPAWAAATTERAYVAALFVVDPRLMKAAGPFRRRMLVANLQSLDYDLYEHTKGRLIVRTGDPVALVGEVADGVGAGSVYWNADVTPFARRRDERVAKALGRPVHEHHGNLVHPPGSITTKKGNVSRSFHSFFKAWKEAEPEAWPEPGEAMIYPDPAEALPRLDDAAPLPEGEGEAHRRLQAFLEKVDRYDDEGERPDLDGSSHLSADLRYGTLAARRVLAEVGDSTPGREAFVKRLAWRDWCAHLLAELPELATDELNDRLADVEWRNDPAELSAWKGGYTGVPIVDAGMRQLRRTGWMPHRVRSIAAGFLVKDLLCDWRLGEAHLRHLLVDGDVASNVVNWQWVAGSGPDAAPYQQVFNAVAQSQRYDPQGEYIRHWVPELAMVDDEAIHEPWAAPPESLATVGVVLGDTYPHPIVDHDEARHRFLVAVGAEEPQEAPSAEDADEDGDADEDADADDEPAADDQPSGALSLG